MIRGAQSSSGSPCGTVKPAAFWPGTFRSLSVFYSVKMTDGLRSSFSPLTEQLNGKIPTQEVINVTVPRCSVLNGESQVLLTECRFIVVS